MIQIGAKPDSGFDDPLGMLKDCHRRIEHFLGILCIVAERAQGRGLTEEEIAAVEAGLNYFRLGGQRHTADEEESLFPRLISVGGFAELDRLEHDHDEAGQLHDDVEGLYRSWISSGSLRDSESRSLLAATGRLRHLYQGHIHVEDNIVFPRALHRCWTKTPLKPSAGNFEPEGTKCHHEVCFSAAAGANMAQ